MTQDELIGSLPSGKFFGGPSSGLLNPTYEGLAQGVPAGKNDRWILPTIPSDRGLITSPLDYDGPEDNPLIDIVNTGGPELREEETVAKTSITDPAKKSPVEPTPKSAYITPATNPTYPLQQPEGLTDWQSFSRRFGKVAAKVGEQVAEDSQRNMQENLKMVAALSTAPVIAKKEFSARLDAALSFMPKGFGI